MNADPIQHLRATVAASTAELDADTSELALERPPRPEFGDYSTNAALLIAPKLSEQPRVVAERLGEFLSASMGDALERFDVAGPGFLNLFLKNSWHLDALGQLVEAGNRFGSGGSPTSEKILIEFVSANPTGPLTAAGGRHAAYGDALARILEFYGHEVGREYYLNDYGSQVQRLGESIRARARGEEVPEGGYEGDYVSELATAIEGAAEDDSDGLARRGVELLVERIKQSLTSFGVEFDHWFSERSLHEDGDEPVASAFERLEEGQYTYVKDDALWLRTTEFGDDKDRILRRAGGEPTYFAADIAYHENKLARGADRLINVWGADHHGYVARMKAAFAALGGDPDKLEVVIMQFVNLLERGERAAMSKRRGDFVTLDDLVAEVGVDVARFLMLQRSHDTTVDLDLDLARQQTDENPVYYIQYAHARICSILDRAESEGLEWNRSPTGLDVALEPAERALVKRLLEFPDEVAEAAERRAPHRIAVYALELARDFTTFYHSCQVLVAESEELKSLRLVLCDVTRTTLANALGLLGVSAPESM